MSAIPDGDADAVIRARDVLAQIRQETVETLERAAQAQRLLDQVQGSLAVAQAALDDTRATRLVQANEQLVLAMLASQRAAEANARALEELSRAAARDPLTGLANRVLLRARLAMAIAEARHTGTGIGLLLLDLSDFRQINDTLGHAAGDKVLQIAARCLQATARESDTVSRHGGDKFMVLLAGVAGSAAAVDLAAGLLAALGRPVQIEGQVLRLAASVAISLYPADGDDAESLMDRGIAAMYRAKWRDSDAAVQRQASTGRPGSIEVRALEALRTPLLGQDQALAGQAHQHRLRQEANLRLIAQMASSLAGQPGTGAMHHAPGDALDIVAAGLRRVHPEIDGALVELGDVLDAAVETCRPALDVRLQQFRVRLPLSSVHVRGDAGLLTLALGNLLDNASRATAAHDEVRFMVWADDALVRMSVSDGGSARPAAALEAGFDLSRVAIPDATQAAGGPCAGWLEVVRAVAHAHRGSLEVTEGGPAQACHVTLTLPRAVASEP